MGLNESNKSRRVYKPESCLNTLDQIQEKFKMRRKIREKSNWSLKSRFLRNSLNRYFSPICWGILFNVDSICTTNAQDSGINISRLRHLEQTSSRSRAAHLIPQPRARERPVAHYRARR